MDTVDIENKLLEFICRSYLVEPGDFSLEKSLVDQGVIDSFGLVEISGFMQQTFAFKVQESEMNRENFGSVKKMVEYIGRRNAG